MDFIKFPGLFRLASWGFFTVHIGAIQGFGCCSSPGFWAPALNPKPETLNPKP